jgi:8-oxo-dGTP pyrophosphatase MutT (NUDIX family)/MOSC domain-containing protein YiiM
MAAQVSEDKASTSARSDRVEPDGQAIGVGVIAVRDSRVLFGLRRSPQGAGTWSCPGGRLERNETVEACALRELWEEAGIEATNPQVVGETDDLFPTGLRFRTIFVQVNWTRGEPVVREPEACARWGWFRWADPPKPLFLPVANLRTTGFHPVTRSPSGAEQVQSSVETARSATVSLGVVEAIHIASTAAAPPRPVEIVRAIPQVGLEGDRYASGTGHFRDKRVSRDLTLVEAEAIEHLAKDHRIELAPGETRRNITTRHVRLEDLIGRRFWVGEVLCEGTRLCEPCQYLADVTGKPLLRPLTHRGGLRADIVRGGHIRRGDRVAGHGDGPPRREQQ